MNDSSGSHVFGVIGLALLLLAGASAMPWSRLTGDIIKDFSLLGDLFPSEEQSVEMIQSPTDGIDPELAALETEMAQQGGNGADVAAADTVAADTVAWIAPLTEAPRIGGRVVIENYTRGPMLGKFAEALKHSSERPVRVAVIGDSFIEGDIFTQDMRRLLQQRYGGNGVGYMCIYSAMPGFRRSVRQSGEGWDVYNILNNASRDTIRNLANEYAVSRVGATAEFRGVNGSEGERSWQRSRAVFLVGDTASVTMQIDGAECTFDLLPSQTPQVVELAGETQRLKITDATPGLVSLGVYLDGVNGVAVDCISNRGSAGLNLKNLNALRSTTIPYDLIIVEFGINALSEQQTEYGAYRIGMKKSLERLKTLFPQADILMMGIADRGSKVNGIVKSLPTCNAMTDAQRRAAREAGVHFYDLRAAQGGENAIVSWRERGLVNADYIHLNHRGGTAMAEEFIAGLMLSIDSASNNDTE